MNKNLFSWYNIKKFLLLVLGIFIATFLTAILFRTADIFDEKEDIYSSNALVHRLFTSFIAAVLLVLFYRLFGKKTK